MGLAAAAAGRAEEAAESPSRPAGGGGERNRRGGGAAGPGRDAAPPDPGPKSWLGGGPAPNFGGRGARAELVGSPPNGPDPDGGPTAALAQRRGKEGRVWGPCGVGFPASCFLERQ